MSRKELIVLTVLIAVLAAVNAVHYVQRRRLEQNYAVVLEEGRRKISINEADAADLEALPGIGPALARRIIDHRQRCGSFRCLEELRQVKGIGDKLYQQIAPFLEL